MKSIKALVTLIAATSIVGFSVYARADDSKGCDGPDRQGRQMDGTDTGMQRGGMKHPYLEGRHPAFGKLLNLTDSQKQTLQASRANERAGMDAAHEKMRIAHEALDKAGKENADDATLNRLSGELAAVIAQQEIARIKARREFVAMLTSEQKQKLDAFEAEHKGPPDWKEKHQDAPKAK